ncbi:UNVERIFIED_ORG: PemK-like, MazF-like toxin of type II toxin-antitoxin system [Herbaspirillum seropedicae]
MIVIEYIEKAVDKATGAETLTARGTESHQDIEEVLVPSASLPNNPVFMTKKFSGVSVCRWQVDSVSAHNATQPTKYVVTLTRPEQAPKECYLRHILKTRGIEINRLLYKNTLVEIEYGHSMDAGDGTGKRVDSRRYVDTVQKGSMPKRRLAIVNQILRGKSGDLVQVIPISSKQLEKPDSGRVIDVSDSLRDLPHYQKQSWAICDMLETVSTSRIMAPVRKVQDKKGFISEYRDLNFGSSVSREVREALNDALIYSVDQPFRMQAVASLESRRDKLSEQVTALKKQEQVLRAQIADLEEDKVRIAAYFNVSLEQIIQIALPVAPVTNLEKDTV